jgi:hypothetical protein
MRGYITDSLAPCLIQVTLAVPAVNLMVGFYEWVNSSDCICAGLGGEVAGTHSQYPSSIPLIDT